MECFKYRTKVTSTETKWRSQSKEECEAFMHYDKDNLGASDFLMIEEILDGKPSRQNEQSFNN